ncbi:rCG23086 [Rattus norvegicus]|uniref:RCG23086 n=1 Tax=Rattus norvegicus TaxID=10116 RepID=A6KNB4_RAT|nr:rCG23086 [Rattus norvegicus]
MKIHSPVAGCSETCSSSCLARCPLLPKKSLPAILWVDGFAPGPRCKVECYRSNVLQPFKDILVIVLMLEALCTSHSLV